MAKKEAKKVIKKAVKKIVEKHLPKIALKKIPVFGIITGIFQGFVAALDGEFLKAGSEVISGVFGSTGLGFAISLGIDMFLII
jgi:hypothetical protein